MARETERPEPPSLGEFFAQQFAEAVADVRRRVVEEPWFGKPLDGPPGGVDGTLYGRAPEEEGEGIDDFSPSGFMRDVTPRPEALEGPEVEALPPPEQDKGIDL